MPTPTTPRIGLIVNPIAGLGGRVGLKGTDGPDAPRRALALGARPVVGDRAAACLRRLLARTRVDVLAAPGAMGADVASGCGLEASATGPVPERATTAADTAIAARAIEAAGVDLLLFAGGDGTARAIRDAVGDRVAALGIPTGVKMHSGVFAASPEDAGDAAAAFLAGDRATDPAEVADADEAALRAGRVSTRLYGRLLVPRAPGRVLAAKAASPARPERDLLDACAEVAAELGDGRLHLVGPGTTTGHVLAALGLEGSLLGVDAVRGGRLVGVDLDERGLLALLGEHPAGTLVLGVVGGQGMLLGRGDQQLSPRVLRRVGSLTVLASLAKLLALDGAPLRVDTGDATLDRELSGYLAVRTGPRRTLLMRVAAAPALEPTPRPAGACP